MTEVEKGEIDLGSGFSMTIHGWSPDRSIPANAERYKDIPDIPRSGALIYCPHGRAGITFDVPGVAEVFGEPRWTVEQWEPLTISPSILAKTCGCHGFIREGKWVSA